MRDRNRTLLAEQSIYKTPLCVARERRRRESRQASEFARITMPSAMLPWVEK